MYDQLSRHEIPWTDDSVKEALTEMAKVVGDSDNIAGGTTGALQTDFETSVSNVFSDDPKAATIAEGDFVPGVIKTDLEPGRATTSRLPGHQRLAAVRGRRAATSSSASPITRRARRSSTTSPPPRRRALGAAGGFSSPNKQLDRPSTRTSSSRRRPGRSARPRRFASTSPTCSPASSGDGGPGPLEAVPGLLPEPDDVDGIAKQMEQAATRHSGPRP